MLTLLLSNILLMEILSQAWEVISHLQDYREKWTTQYGSWMYGILFLIIFCETGLVVMPFLPGDSLLFATGALCGQGAGKLDIWWVLVLLPVAAIIGDSVNYWTGRFLGPKVFKRNKSLLFNSDILHKTQSFYERHGRKMVIMARFVPLIRTFAPFVAGVGKMNYPIFLTYGILGAYIWVGVCAGAGYYFGNMPWVKEHFELIVLAVIGISVLPAILAWFGSKRESKSPAQSPQV